MKRLLASALLALGCASPTHAQDASTDRDAVDRADTSLDAAHGEDAREDSAVAVMDASDARATDGSDAAITFEEAVDRYLASEAEPPSPSLLDELDTVYRDVTFAQTLDAVRHGRARISTRAAGVQSWRWTNPLSGVESPWFSYVPDALARTPDAAAPLVLFLHWAGGSGDAVATDPSFQAAADALGVILAAPTSDPACDWSGSERCMSQVLSSLRTIKRQWRIDDSRVVLSGFSMGGRGSFSTGAAYPEPWCAVLPVAGSIGAILNTTDVARHQSYCCPHAENLRDARTQHTIGGADLAIAVAFNQGCAACFTALGLDARYSEPPGVGHTIELPPWRASVEWGLARPRESYPRRITYNLRAHTSSITPGGVFFHQTLRDSLYWVAIEARRDPSQPARIDASTDGAAITVNTTNVERLTVFVSDEIAPMDRPVPVTVNGALVHNAMIARDRRFLLREARRRADRTMTFAASVSLDVM